jgi:hypothetical protein
MATVATMRWMAPVVGVARPVLILRLEGGPDDGEERLVPAAVSVVPPERINASVEAEGWYVRHPEPPAQWTWRYLWVAHDDRGDVPAS